jgi:hypothetical protein
MSLETAPQRDRRRFRRSEASDYLWEQHEIKRAPATLAKLAVKGGGPEITYIGALPFYTSAALDAYAKQITSQPVRSTAERPVRSTAGRHQALTESGKAA